MGTNQAPSCVRAGTFSLMLGILACSNLPLRAQQVDALPDGEVGTEYNYQIRTLGGLPPLKWRLVAGELPPGIQLRVSGALQGRPTRARRDAYQFLVEVSDSSEPPQTSLQRFSMVIRAAPLRILTEPHSLRIAPGPQNDLGSAAPTPDAKPPSLAQEGRLTGKLRPRWEPTVPAMARPAEARSARTRPEENDQGTAVSADANGKKKGELNPATFVWIYEYSKTGKRFLLYDPTEEEKRPVQFNVDLESTLVIEPDPDLMEEDLSLNKLYMSAELASGDTKKKVEVIGYSEVGKDQASAEAQRGMAFQSAANIQSMMLNMAFTAEDILRHVYQLPENGCASERMSEEEVKARIKDVDKQIAKEGDEHLKRVEDRFRLYRPEIEKISDFFLDRSNLEIVRIIGSEVFWIDSASLHAIAQQFKENLSIALNGKASDAARKDALRDLLERTKLVHEDFKEVRLEIRRMTKDYEKNYPLRRRAQPSKKPGARQDEFEPRTENEQTLITLQAELPTKQLDEKKKRELCQLITSYATVVYSEQWRRDALGKLKRLFSRGTISLVNNTAKDGDRLTLTIEARGTDGESTGIPAVFEIPVKRFGAKLVLASSLLFLKRADLGETDVHPPAGSAVAPLTAVNFAPSPGTTFGVVFLKRGNGGMSRFLRTLGPGIGLNVSFMNFDDPGFDLASNTFTDTTGVNVQVGAGVVGSLFDNKLQFAHGWNLNADRKRRYWGLGFDFIKISKELVNYIKK